MQHNNMHCIYISVKKRVIERMDTDGMQSKESQLIGFLHHINMFRRCLTYSLVNTSELRPGQNY